MCVMSKRPTPSRTTACSASTPSYWTGISNTAAGARFVDFHGWEMPGQYEGILAETRRGPGHGGRFDLCHLGRLVIIGLDREALTR